MARLTELTIDMKTVVVASATAATPSQETKTEGASTSAERYDRYCTQYVPATY